MWTRRYGEYTGRVWEDPLPDRISCQSQDRAAVMKAFENLYMNLNGEMNGRLLRTANRVPCTKRS